MLLLLCDDGESDVGIAHRRGREPTLSAPKSTSMTAPMSGDGRIVEAHDRIDEERNERLGTVDDVRAQPWVRILRSGR